MSSIAIDRKDGLSSSVAVKVPCRVATTANIALYGQQTIDGIAVVAGDYVLVKNQSAGYENGIYVADTGQWRRSRDFNKTRDVAYGTQVFVVAGSLQSRSGWYVASPNPVNIGIDVITFDQNMLLDLDQLEGYVDDAQVASTQAQASQAASAASAVTAISARDAAIAAAASVNLPALTANTMLVDNSAGTARQAKTFAQVNDLLEKSTWSLDNNTLYKSRSNKDRWLDSVVVAELLNYDPTGAVANGDMILQSAVNIALAANRSEVVLPKGLLRMAGAVSIVNPISGGKALRIVGQGEDVSTLQSDTTNINLLEVGPRGATLAGNAQSGQITLEGFGCIFGVASTAGSSIDVRNINGLNIKDCDLGGFPSCLALGLAASAVNDAINIYLSNTSGQSGSVSGNAGIRLGSGGNLHISGSSKWNGNVVSPLIKHSDAAYNWDGVYCIGTIGEGWTGYIVSAGKGIVNAEWTGGQVDRASIVAFEAGATVAASGSDRNWNIQTQIMEGPLGNVAQFGCVFGNGGGNSEGHRVSNCQMQGLTNNAVYVVSGSAVITGNKFQACGNSGVALIRMGPNTTGAISGNFSYKGAADGARTSALNGILFEGTGVGNRVQVGNKFLGVSGAEVTGTA